MKRLIRFLQKDIWRITPGEVSPVEYLLLEVLKKLLLAIRFFTIPSDQIEAATLEGANSFQLFRYVTFPFIRPTVYTCTYLCFIWSFNAFDILKVMTNGGPAEMTTTMSIMVQREAFQFFEISNASTMSVIMFVLMISVIVIFTLLSKLVRRVKR